LPSDDNALLANAPSESRNLPQSPVHSCFDTVFYGR
jgi:hypothetical protein